MSHVRMKLLVLGGAGYIGSHFVKEALQAGHQCTVFDNLSLGHRSFVPKAAQFIEGDLLNREQLSKAIAQVEPDFILHYAAKALVGESVSSPDLYYSNNVVGTFNLLDVLKEQKKSVGLVFSSSCAIFGSPEKMPVSESMPKNPQSPYGWSKLICEQMISDFCHAYGQSAFCLRYFNAAGADGCAHIGEKHDPETHLIPNILLRARDGETLTIFGDNYNTPDGTCVRDYVHVTDLAFTHLIACEKLYTGECKGFNTLNLGSGKGYSNLEVVKMAEKVIGKPIQYVIGEARQGDASALWAANEKAKRILSYDFKHSSLENIITTAWNWHKKDL